MIVGMNDQRIGRALRALRQRRRIRQTDLGQLAGLSQSSVSLVERGHLDRLSLRALRALFAAVDATFEGVVRFRGAEIDRIVDKRHATLVDRVVAMLTAAGWQVAVEVSINHYGDRGSVDVLAFDRLARVVAVVEIKSELAGVEETVRRLDVKARLAPGLCLARFGERPARVARLLVLPRSATSWRAVRRFSSTFDVALPQRGRAVSRWLAQSQGPLAG